MFKLYTMFAQEKWFSVNLKRCVCVCILPEMVKRPPSIDVHTLVRKNSKLQIMLVLWDRIFWYLLRQIERDNEREKREGIQMSMWLILESGVKNAAEQSDPPLFKVAHLRLVELCAVIPFGQWDVSSWEY